MEASPRAGASVGVSPARGETVGSLPNRRPSTPLWCGRGRCPRAGAGAEIKVRA